MKTKKPLYKVIKGWAMKCKGYDRKWIAIEQGTDMVYDVPCEIRIKVKYLGVKE